MRNLLLVRSTLLLVLVASVATAKEREPVSRYLFVSSNPGDEISPVYVAGELATILRFPDMVDPLKTRMMGWEGRFEPLLAGGHLVVVIPLKDLEKTDRFLMVVTLQNGRELPFTVTSRDRRFDHQVNVLLDDPSPESLRGQLEYTRERKKALEVENERLRSEESSIDHALAALLVKDAVSLTPLLPKYTSLLKSPEGVEFKVTVLASKKPKKVAVVINVKNNNASEAWGLMEARLVTEGNEVQKPFALRATRDSWGPGGESGQLAFVLDESAFDPKDLPDRLVLELFRRGSGLREVWVFLDKQLMQ